MMNTYHTINSAGLLVLTVGWFLVGSIITGMVASHLIIRAESRGYHRGLGR